jgi:hypothetical protein
MGARINNAQANMQEYQVQPVASISAALQNAVNQRLLMNAMQSALQQNQYSMQSSSVDSSAEFQAPFAAAVAPNAPAIGLSIGLRSDSFGRSNDQSGEGGENKPLDLDRKPSATELELGTRSLSTASQIREQNPPSLTPLQPMEGHITIANQTSDFQGRAAVGSPRNPSMTDLPHSNTNKILWPPALFQRLIWAITR